MAASAMTNAVSVPAPTGGWNARDSLDDMEASDAVKMVNLIPRSGWVEARNGYGLFLYTWASLPRCLCGIPFCIQ